MRSQVSLVVVKVKRQLNLFLVLCFVTILLLLISYEKEEEAGEEEQYRLGKNKRVQYGNPEWNYYYYSRGEIKLENSASASSGQKQKQQQEEEEKQRLDLNENPSRTLREYDEGTTAIKSIKITSKDQYSRDQYSESEIKTEINQEKLIKIPSEFSENLWRRVVNLRPRPSKIQSKLNVKLVKNSNNHKNNNSSFLRNGKKFQSPTDENDDDIPGYYQDDRILKQLDWIEKVSDLPFVQNLKPKKILFLDGFYSYYGLNGSLTCPGRKTGSGAPSSGFESKCTLVEDHWYTGFHRDLESFDAVVGIRNWEYRLYEGKLPRHIKQILFTLESPYVTKHADFSVNNALLASYYRGSDITVPYGKWAAFSQISNNSSLLTDRNIKGNTKSTNSITNPSKNTQNSYPDSSTNNFNNAKHSTTIRKIKTKTRLAAIVVSDCTPQNNRLKYVEELSKFMTVDVYGKCGNLTCSKDLKCFDWLGKTYKFYLAFENANCRDYITEKFFQNALQHNLVPVVLGAHPKDYQYAAPPNSFIHVENFESPKDLAAYLHFLDKNETAYEKYFEWRDQGQFIDHWQYFFCRICALLHYGDFHKSPIWPREGSTWKNLNQCLPPGRWYWDREN